MGKDERETKGEGGRGREVWIGRGGGRERGGREGGGEGVRGEGEGAVYIQQEKKQQRGSL